MNIANETSCGCKGVRFCAICLHTDRVLQLNFDKSYVDLSTFQHFLVSNINSEQRWFPIPAKQNYTRGELEILCKSCRTNEKLIKECVEPLSQKLILVEKFISFEEESYLLSKIDNYPWILSQSGRRKQDFGPRVNFKHKKVKIGHYVGMPKYAEPLLSKMQNIDGLEEYIPFELCNLEYEFERGSCIEFHTDDTWIWGERLITINLIEGSVMTLINEKDKIIVYVPMPHRSLLCMAGNMRYEWKHSVSKDHVFGRRIALTMREPSTNFKSGDLYEKWGKVLIERGKTFIEV
uniref:Fe2OG dioxygenase domain-containing protein n=1 Tax=Romanomermis culicivorax TaxID=13658 RepID=A0A915IKG9_ROMCU